MITLDEILNRYDKIYLLGNKSTTSKELKKMMAERGKEFTEIWEDNKDIRTDEKSTVYPDDLGQINEGIVVLAMEPKYIAKWIEVCEKELNTDFVDGFELVYADTYIDCERKGNNCLLDRCKHCKASYHSCPVRRKYYNNTKSKTIRQIAFKAGFICNLKCEYCCEFLPYFDKRHIIDFDVEQYKTDLKKISDSCEYIHTLSFSGGDVMLNKGLAELLDYLKILENVGYVYILTNGTYVPSTTVLDALERNKERVSIVINDYEINQKASPLMTELVSRGIKCRLRPNEGWYDFKDRSFRNRTVGELKILYRNCIFDRTDTAYYIYCNGIISMRCGVANGILHYMNLHEECRDDYVDIRKLSVEELTQELDRIEKRDFVNMCNYCRGCGIENRNLKPAEMQLKK